MAVAPSPEHDDLWRLALESSRVGTWVVFLDTGAFQASAAFARMLGTTVAALEDLETAWGGFGVPADVAEARGRLLTLASGPDGGTFELEHRLRSSDGRVFWALSRGTVHTVDRRRALTGSTMDIDGHVRTRLELDAALRRLGVSLTAVGGYIMEWRDAADEIVFVGAAGDRPRGPITLAEALSEVHQDDRRTVRAALESARTSGQPCLVDFRASHGRSGFRRRLARVARSGAADDVLVTAVVIDAADLRVFSGADSLVGTGGPHPFREAAELSREAMLAFDDDGRITFVTTAAATLLGDEVAALIGRSWADLCVPDDVPIVARGLAARRAGGHARWEFRVRRRDGPEVWIEDSGAALADASGRFISRVSIWTDVTERHERERELSETLQAKDGLVREVHHRVRNNFQVVSSLLNLQFRDAEVASLPDRIRDMQNRVGTMAHLHSLLYESADPSVADAQRYLGRLVSTVTHSFEDTAGRVHVALTGDAVHLPTDTGLRLGMVVNELLSNALKHAFPAGRSGRVDIGLLQAADAFELSVADDGIGFEPGVAEGTAAGATLGLPLVGDLATQLHGSLAIETAPGRGTRVRVTGRVDPSGDDDRNG
ncbi:MAG: PAS domain S-box protein [Vicinamibacterales bacterium]